MGNIRLKEIRNQAIGAITELMKKCNLKTIEAVDIDEGNSPILQENIDDEDGTYTLDRIGLDVQGNPYFEGSSCYDNVTFTIDTISTDALLEIQEWLEDNEEGLEDIDGSLTEEQKEGIRDEVDSYLAPVFQDAVERRHLVNEIIDDIYSYIAETCEWGDYEDDEYSISDVHIAVQSILYHKITD